MLPNRILYLSFWKRNEKDDDAKGMQEKDMDETQMSAPQQTTDGDTHMPQANATGPGGSTLGLLGSVGGLQGMAVTPFNMNPQTPRGKEIVEQLTSGGKLTMAAVQEFVGAANVCTQVCGQPASPGNVDGVVCCPSPSATDGEGLLQVRACSLPPSACGGLPGGADGLGPPATGASH